MGNEMLEISTKELGLAAYIKMNGAVLLSHDGNSGFKFESTRTVQKWKMAYLNSCCRRHDKELMDLRRIMS